MVTAEEGNVTRAAARLGLQQPPLTRAIRGLEAELGLALFRRTPRGMEVTEAGAILVEEAKALLERAAELPRIAERAARGELGRLRVGYTSSAAFHPFVTRQLREFRSAWPGVELALEEDGTLALAQAVLEKRLDAAILRSPVEAQGLTVERLLEEPMVLALPVGHRLAGRGEARLAALAGETFILYRRPSGPGLHDAIIAACQTAGFSPQVGQEAPRLPSTLSLVAAGLGVTIVPASMRRMNVEGIAWLPIADAAGLVAPLFLARLAAARSKIVARFCETVARKAAQDWPQASAKDE
jgi:DNA-binding transcriptional LysR family regulator